MNKSLSGDEILKLINGKGKILTYTQLASYQNIDDVLEPYGCAVILYLSEHYYGHWVCLFKFNDTTIEFFDPYGMPPDDQLAFIPEHFRKISKQELPHLTALLWKSGKEIEYNDHKLQKDASDINTCGRHVACRIAMKELHIDDYADFINSFTGINPDEFVTIMTNY